MVVYAMSKVALRYIQTVLFPLSWPISNLRGKTDRQTDRRTDRRSQTQGGIANDCGQIIMDGIAHF